eukprot:jgi/Botrbrau1/10439/Bobra.0133s0046.1
MQDIDTIFFDLDGTLYPIENGYEAHTRNRVLDYMHVRLGIPRESTFEIWWRQFQRHNQSLKGLRSAGYDFDTDDYWDYIREGRERFLQHDPEVRSLVESLPQKNKWVFTNCNEKHALLALEALGLQGLFSGVIGADAMGDVCKPDQAAFKVALDVAGASAERSLMVEDSLKNLRTARSLGMATLLVHGHTVHEEGNSKQDIEGAVDAAVHQLALEAVKEALPHLWR